MWKPSISYPYSILLLLSFSGLVLFLLKYWRSFGNSVLKTRGREDAFTTLRMEYEARLMVISAVLEFRAESGLMSAGGI